MKQNIRICVIKDHNRKQLAGYLEQMHAQRFAYYVIGRGWEELRNPLGNEIDEYDTSQATWLLAISEDSGDVLGAVRLIPTDCPNLLADKFHHCVTAMEMPLDPKVWEITRLYMTKKDRLVEAQDGHLVYRHLIMGMLEFAYSKGVTAMVGAFDTFFLGQLEQFKWDYKPMGLPNDYPEGTCIAVWIELTREMIDRHQAMVGFEQHLVCEEPEKHLKALPSGFVAEETYALIAACKNGNQKALAVLMELIPLLGSHQPKEVREKAERDVTVLYDAVMAELGHRYGKDAQAMIKAAMPFVDDELTHVRH